MGTEACPFCGHLTSIVRDFGNRKHYSDCKLYVATLEELAAFMDHQDSALRHNNPARRMFRQAAEQLRRLEQIDAAALQVVDDQRARFT